MTALTGPMITNFIAFQMHKNTGRYSQPGPPSSISTIRKLATYNLSSPTCLVTPDGAEDRLRVGGNLGLEGELLAVDLDRR